MLDTAQARVNETHRQKHAISDLPNTYARAATRVKDIAHDHMARRSLPAGVTRRLCVAPMMSYTDRHFRYLLRLLAPNALLYTEMITTGAVLNGSGRCLAHDPLEQPTALQLGGCDPAQLALAAQRGERAGFAEINLNVGCPSPRVASARFGACLMADPALVASCVSAMRSACALPVTVKCRLGIDDHDNYEFLARFVGALEQVCVDALVVHARIAVLDGLTPEQNRDIPPLDYHRVMRLRNDFPALPVILNGGLRCTASVAEALAWADGVMVGRAACSDPLFVARLDEHVYGTPMPDEHEVLRRYCDYAKRQVSLGESFGAIGKRALGLFTARPGARAFRRALTQAIHSGSQDPDALLAAADNVTQARIHEVELRAGARPALST